MSLSTAGLWTTFLWFFIYAIKYTWKKSLLPLSHNRRPATELTVKHANIRLKTEAFNVHHDKLCTWLHNSLFWRQSLLKLYDLGSFLGVIGMLVGFGLLFLTATSLSSDILQSGRDSIVSPVTKRGLDPDVTPPVALTSHLPRINPIIPGLTVPLSHLPLILLTLAISQIIHESGHAIAAALHRIPMISCGIAVTFIIPSAFVTLSALRLEKLPPRDRLQIVSSGCFHNLVLLCLLLSVAWSGTGSLPIWIFFQDISAQGRLVVSVDYDSPLATHLPVGTLITKIDDFSMASVSSGDPWDHYLLRPSSHSMQGWCTDTSLLHKALAPTCTSLSNAYSCFVSKMDESVQYELDPVRIFTDNLQRCNSFAECSPLTSCVVPRRDQQLVRISVMRDHAIQSGEDMIVWKGPKEEIWEQVQVCNYRPRMPLVSSKLPELASTFFEYMRIANLSLYLVNMLPIAALDGYQLLVALLQLFCGRESNSESPDLEALHHTTRISREGRVQRTCQTFLSFLALLLVVFCGLLGTLSWVMK